MATKNLLQAINEGLAEEMRSDDTVMVITRDPAGGAATAERLLALSRSGRSQPDAYPGAEEPPQPPRTTSRTETKDEP